MGRVASIGCIACGVLCLGETPAQVHHIREGGIARNHWLTIPLCPEHHTGTESSIHKARPKLMLQLGLESEFDLLAMVISRLYGK